MKIGDKVLKSHTRYGDNNGNSIYTITDILGPIYEITTVPDEFNRQSTKVYYETADQLDPYEDVTVDDHYFASTIYYNGDDVKIQSKEVDGVKYYFIIRNNTAIRIHFSHWRVFGQYKFSKNDEVYILPSAILKAQMRDNGKVNHFNNSYCRVEEISNDLQRHIKDYYNISKGKIIREIANSYYLVATANGPMVYSLEQLRLTKKHVVKAKVLTGNFLDKTTNKPVKFVSSTIVSSIVFCKVMDLETSKEYNTNLKNLKKIKDV